VIIIKSKMDLENQYKCSKYKDRQTEADKEVGNYISELGFLK